MDLVKIQDMTGSTELGNSFGDESSSRSLGNSLEIAPQQPSGSDFLHWPDADSGGKS